MNNPIDFRADSDVCGTTRRILQSFGAGPQDELNPSDNQKNTLLAVCEYLLDFNIPSDLLEQCLAVQLFLDSDIPLSLYNKRNLAEVLAFFESVTLPLHDVDALPKIITSVIQIYTTDPAADKIGSIPSLIGILAMNSLFFLFADNLIPPNYLTSQLDLLLPENSEQPFVKDSRRYCQRAVEQLLIATRDDSLDTKSYLESMPHVKDLLIRYPFDRTLHYIKELLLTYKQSLAPSPLRTVFHPFLEGKVVSPAFDWPNTDFVTLWEIQHALDLPKQTLSQIISGTDPQIKDFLTSLRPQHVEVLTPTLSAQPSYIQAKKEDDKQVRPPKRRSTTRLPSDVPHKSPDIEVHQKKKKRRFSEEETQNLIDGVRKYGVGRWKNILSNYKFDNRSCVDLKDKWRNLEFSRMRTSNKSKPAPAAPPPLERTNTAILPSVTSDIYRPQPKPQDLIPSLMDSTSLDFTRSGL